MEQDELKKIEQLENKYLKKFYYFLKALEDELFIGFRTKEDIKSDWIEKYKSGISDFAVGAERIIYSLLNGKGIGQPNSAPVGSDMFFEVDDAYIHIDLKTVQTDNMGDFTKSIFVGVNQNSYRAEIKRRIKGKSNVSFEPKRFYEPALPKFYKLKDGKYKICLTYFITILYERENLNILNISLICMPNGSLISQYGDNILQAGKNLDKTRFRFTEIPNFELLDNKPKRVKVIYFCENMKEEFKKKLDFFENIYRSQD